MLPGVCGGRVQVRLGLAQAGRLPPAGCASGHALRSSGSLRTALLYSCTPRPSDAPTIVLVAGICARLPGTPDAGRLKGGTRCPSGAAGAQEVARSRRTRRGAHERCIQSGTWYSFEHLAPLRCCAERQAAIAAARARAVRASISPLAAMDATEVDAPAAPVVAAEPEAPAEAPAVKPLTPVNMLRPGTSGHDLVVKARAPEWSGPHVQLRGAHALRRRWLRSSRR